MRPVAAFEASGDVAAVPIIQQPFADFYRQHFRRSFALAIALTGSASVAEDLVQDAFADAHRQWERIGGYDQPEAWVRRSVLNRATSLRRRWATRQRALPRLEIVTSVGLDSRDNELWRRVRALPRRQAQLVALVYVEGLSVAGAADALGMKPSTATTHLTRAKQRLQRDLEAWKEES